MRRLTSAIVAFFIIGTVLASTTDSLFLKMPDNLLPTLARKQRFELAEYFKAGKADSVPNLFGNKTIIQKYDTTNCHIILKTSITGTTEIKKFTFSTGENIIGIIQSVNQPFRFSNIQFFTETWQPFQLTIELPDYQTWINQTQLIESNLNSIWVKNLLQKSYFSMQFTETNELEIENNVLNTLNVDDLKMVMPFFVSKTVQIKFVK